jgi:hypothetical protein
MLLLGLAAGLWHVRNPLAADADAEAMQGSPAAG